MLPEHQPPKVVWEHRVDQALVEFPAKCQALQVGGKLCVIQGLVEVIAQHEPFKAVWQPGVSEVLVESIAGFEHPLSGGKYHVGECLVVAVPEVQGFKVWRQSCMEQRPIESSGEFKVQQRCREPGPAVAKIAFKSQGAKVGRQHQAVQLVAVRM